MKLSMVGIIVQDMSQAIAFYECLGFAVSQKYSEDYVELTNSTIRISLNTVEMVTGVYGFQPSLSGERLELAFELESNEALDQLYLKMEQEQYQVLKAPWLAPWGQYYALIADVDGNMLSLFVNQ